VVLNTSSPSEFSGSQLGSGITSPATTAAPLVSHWDLQQVAQGEIAQQPRSTLFGVSPEERISSYAETTPGSEKETVGSDYGNNSPLQSYSPKSTRNLPETSPDLAPLVEKLAIDPVHILSTSQIEKGKPQRGILI
jgi:hypothetical protein